MLCDLQRHNKAAVVSTIPDMEDKGFYLGEVVYEMKDYCSHLCCYVEYDIIPQEALDNIK